MQSEEEFCRAESGSDPDRAGGWLSPLQSTPCRLGGLARGRCVLIVLFTLLPVAQVESPRGHGAGKWQAQGPAHAASGPPPPPGRTTLVGLRLRVSPRKQAETGGTSKLRSGTVGRQEAGGRAHPPTPSTSSMQGFRGLEPPTPISQPYLGLPSLWVETGKPSGQAGSPA